MIETTYRNRRARSIENDEVRVTVTQEGGHIAEILHKQTGVNPLWSPPWASIEPSTYDRARNPEYGSDAESKLLAGILGHNLCLDLFGAPSPEEAAAGITVHGEASIAPYEITGHNQEIHMQCVLRQAGLQFYRTIRLNGRVLAIDETVTNLSALDRPIAWTQHVTLGPPFLERGATEFRAPATQSCSLEGGVGQIDLQRYSSASVSGSFTTYLMDPQQERAFFFAFSPASKVLIGYIWKRADFPWLGVWEENRSRTNPPWNAETQTRGMEFGASPMPESRRKMIDRNNMFGVPAYRWAPAKTKAQVRYHAFITTAASIPERIDQLEVEIPA